MIFFRADNSEPIDGFKAKNLNMSNTVKNMENHIRNANVSPYISLAEDITTVAFKYAYGNRSSKGLENKLRYNEKYSPIYLVELKQDSYEKGVVPNDVCKDIKDSEKILYYTQDSLNEVLGNADFLRADKEILVYREIKKENIFEVHPFLVDVLVALRVQNEQNGGNCYTIEAAYDVIINNIKNGRFSKKNVNEILENIEMNDIEYQFFEEFYKNRTNLVDSFKKVFPNAYPKINKKDGLTDEMKELLVAATGLRVQILKDVEQQFFLKDETLKKWYEKHVLEDLSPNLFKSFFDGYKLPAEEFVMMSTANDEEHYRLAGTAQIYGVRKNIELSPKVSSGMKFIVDDNDKIVGGKYKYYKVNSKGYEKHEYTKVVPNPILMEKSKYVAINLKNDFAKKQREDYINGCRKIRKIGEKYYAFDEDYYCLEVGKELFNVGTFVSHKYYIKDYVMDENGERSLYDPQGFDYFRLDKGGARRNGLSGKITKLNFSIFSENDLETLLLESQDSYKQLIENGKIEKTLKSRTPLERLVKTIANTIINSTHMEINEKRMVDIDKKESMKKFYSNLYEEIFENKCELTMQTKENLDKIIRSVFRVAYRQKINIDEIFSDEIKKLEDDYEKKHEKAVAHCDEIANRYGNYDPITSKEFEKVIRIEDEIELQKKFNSQVKEKFVKMVLRDKREREL